MDNPTGTAPAFALYGDGRIFPDVLHCEAIVTRASRHGWTIARHRHPDLHQFFLIQSGAATLRLSTGDRPLTPPVAVSVPSQLDHGFRFAAKTEGLVVTVPVAALAAVSGAGLQQLHVVPVAARTALLFDVIARRHADPSGLRDVALRGLVVALACDLIADDSAPGDRSATLYHRFAQAVRTHAADGWGVSDYVAHLGTSATQLNRTVRSHADQSVMGVVQTVLMGEAARRLAYTRQPVAAIAYDLGFSDPGYFARVFRKALGTSPRLYRQALR